MRGGGTRGLRFGVLGPIEVWRDDEPVRLGGERQRLLLALLLLHCNELLTTGQLLEEMFGGSRSVGAVNALHAAVSRLRRVLEDGDDGAALVTRSGGYLLSARAEQLDALVFEGLLAKGQKLLAAGDPASAATCLDEALGLWRGAALADLATVDVLQPEMRRLEQLRLVARMERVQCGLAVGAHDEMIPELEKLLVADPLSERARGQLMVALYRADRQADALEVYRQTSVLLRDELGLSPSRRLQELERQVLRQDPALDPAARSPLRAAGAEQSPMVCPFKGLAPFDRSDAGYFCGREDMVSELVARLAESTFVGVVGPSGIGKSSLLRAGVLATLYGGGLPGSTTWRQVLVRPGEHPCAELARALDTPGVGQTLSELAPGARVVVAVDQLEELFTVCEDEGERVAFLEQLADGARDAERRAVIAVSLRADFYGRCASYPEFARLLSSGHVLVGPMGRQELAQAIELPAARAGLEVERALVERLVADVIGEPGGLPLLSTMLLELWRVRDGRVLRAGSYIASGGVRGAVARLAEDAYLRLNEAEQAVARRVLLRLARGQEGMLLRRRVPIAELDQLSGSGPVLTALTDARLLTRSDGEIEVSHEALLQEWPRYRAWLDEDQVGRRLHTHLAGSSRAWDAGGRDPGDLYRGARLAAALDWSGRQRDELSALERDFLRASRRAGERAGRRLQAILAGVATLLAISLIAGVIALVQNQHATTEARRAVAQQLGAEAVINPRIDLAMLLAREAVSLDRTPQTESTLLATLLRSPAAIASFELPFGVRPLSLTLSPDARTLLVGANNNVLYDYDPTTRTQQRRPLANFSADPWPVYSADGSLLLLSDNGNPPGLDVLDARTWRRVARLAFDRRWLTTPTVDSFGSSVLMSPDHRTAYYAYAVSGPTGAPGAGYLDRWTLPGGRLISSSGVSPSGLLGIRLVDDGARLIVLGDKTVETLSARTLRPQRSVAVNSPTPLGLPAAISPNGRSAAFGTADGSVAFVDLSTGAVKAGSGGHTARVQSLAYSPDGRQLVSTADDNRVIVWDQGTAQPREILSGHAGRPTGIAFSADSRTLYTSSLDGTVLTWDLASGRRFGRPFTVGPGLAPSPLQDTPIAPPLALAPDGSRFATRTAASRIGIFSTRTLQQDASLPIPRAGTVTALAWSPHGATLAVGGYGGLLQLWDISGRPHLLRSLIIARPHPAGTEAIQSLVFSPGGRLLAATDQSQTNDGSAPDGHLFVWRAGTSAPMTGPVQLGAAGNQVAFSPRERVLAVALGDGRVAVLNPSGRQLRTIHPIEGRNGGTVSLAFAPDGTLATGTYAGIVQRWRTSTGAAIGHPLLANAAPVASIAFDRSGQRFATTGGPEGGLKIWFTATLQQEGATLDPEQGTAGNVAFVPGGQALVSVDADGNGSLWPVRVGAWESHACVVAGRGFTHEEWSRFVTGYPYRQVCS